MIKISSSVSEIFRKSIEFFLSGVRFPWSHDVGEMSQVRVFTLLGDANIRKYVNKTSRRASQDIKGAQVLSCGQFEIFRDTLEKIRSESDVCIVSCLTSFLTNAEGPDTNTVSQLIDPVLQDIREVLDEVCVANPEVQYLISPPMYQSSPVWYREGLPEVLTSFSAVMSQDKPANLNILASFPTPSYDSSGIHLTPYSGLEFMMHLFDNSKETLANLERPADAKAAKTSEGTRVLEDRVMALEQDHRRLNGVVEGKIAIDAEEADYRENVSNLDSFTLAGLPRLSPDLVGKAWQDAAVKDVQGFIRLLMGRDMGIHFIKNSTARHKDADIKYTVKMKDVQDSKLIRDKFGSFFSGGADKRPPEMKPYSVRNRITPGTQVRISVLQVLARRYKVSNPGSKVKVIGYDPRPLIKIIPPSNAKDSRMLTYGYVEAVKTLPTNFTEAELDFIFQKVNPRLCGQLRSIFICLSDDVFRKKKIRSRPEVPGAGAEESENAVDADETNADADARSTSGRSESGKASGKGRKNQKRGASASPDTAVPPKR